MNLNVFTVTILLTVKINTKKKKLQLADLPTFLFETQIAACWLADLSDCDGNIDPCTVYSIILIKSAKLSFIGLHTQIECHPTKLLRVEVQFYLSWTENLFTPTGHSDRQMS
jgi:hypothetical protein